MAIALGILVAASFGSGDFLGGRASVSSGTTTVLAISQLCSVLTVVVAAAFVSARVTGGDVLLGTSAGIVNVAGLAVLYRALANHAAGVVAPITAVVGAIVPVAWGLLRGERPSLLVAAGAIAAIVAASLVAYDPTPRTQRLAAGAAEAVVAGAALGASLVLFAETTTGSGLWPVVAARASAFVLVGTVWLAVRCRPARPTREEAASRHTLAAGAGVLDASANILLLLAVRRGLLVVVAPVAALAPAFTVALSWLFLHERLHMSQRVGFVVALLGIALVAAG